MMNDWQVVEDMLDFVIVECPHCAKTKNVVKKDLRFSGVDTLSKSGLLQCSKCQKFFYIGVQAVKVFKTFCG